MQIAAIDNAIEVCRKHLDNTHSRNTEVEAFLTRYLVVMICAEFEERCEALVHDRARRVGDTYVAAFMQSASAQLLRSIGVGELSGFLNRFGRDCKEKFQQTVVNTDAHRAYDTIVSNRHDTAHRSGGGMTFDELASLYPKSLDVLQAFADALGLTLQGSKVAPGTGGSVSSS